MPNYFARASGNINATNVWATTPSGTAGAQTFVAGDVLYANSFTITVNVSTDLGSTGEVRNDNTNGATAGGSFTLSNGVTLTANAFAGSAFNVICVVYSGAAGNSASIVGNGTGSPSGQGQCIANNSSGTLNITGNLTGGAGTAQHGAVNNSNGTINVTGNCTGGASGNSYGVLNNSNGTINVTGNCTGGSADGANGARNASVGALTITGNVTGGSVTGASGANNTSTGTLTIVGSAIASNNASGANNASTGILTVKRAVGNGWGIGTTGISNVAGVQSQVAGSQTRVEEFELGALGQFPVNGAVSCPDLTNNVCIVHRLGTTKKTLIDPSANTGMPAEANVRHGTSYALGNMTGTMRVPSAASVALGVAVDNTTGTAALTPAAVWDALMSGMNTSGSIGARLKNAATVETTGQALADALSPQP